MKKLLFSLFVLSSAFSFGQSQELEGRIVIEPMIGIPNAGKAYLNTLEFGTGSDENYVVTGPPVQFGGRLEYIATEHIGVGLEVNYEKSGYERNYQTYSSVTGMQIDTAQIWGLTKLRVMARFMAHFGRAEKVDWYAGAALGYVQETQTNSENRPDITDYNFLFVHKFIDEITTPLSARIYFGARFMFVDNFGLTTELGLGGGSIFQLGLSVRI